MDYPAAVIQSNLAYAEVTVSVLINRESDPLPDKSHARAATNVTFGYTQ